MTTYQRNVDEVELFWAPGCSSCAKAKEFLAERGIIFCSSNIAEQPEKLDELIALGFRGVPVVRKGERYMPAVSLQNVHELFGITVESNRLPVPVLVERWIDILARTRDIIAVIPDDRLDDLPHPDRKRLLRDLAGHIYQVPEAFLLTMIDGVADTSAVISRPCAELGTTDDLLGYVDATLNRLKDWWRDVEGQPLPQFVPSYYGSQGLDEFVERAVWHSAHHVRQLDDFMSRTLSIEKSMPPELYSGLPLPRSVW